MFEFMLDMFNYESRVVGRWDSETGDRMVSTARVSDGRDPFETAFQHPDYNDGKMVIVESYGNEREASEGHERWVNVMTVGPLPDVLVDCANAGIAQVAQALGKEMRFPRKGAFSPSGYGIGLSE